MISLKIRGLLLLLVGTGFGLMLSLGSGVLAERSPASADSSLPWEQARLLAEVMERIKREYVEPIDDQKLIESAVRGMVLELDPHSQFLGSTDYEEIRISTTGNYSGVGVEVHLQEGRVTVIAPIEGTPAAQAGIRTGDTIVSIDGVPVDEHNISDTIRRMRGRPGTRVSLSVARSGEPEPLGFSLTRSNVQVHSVRAQMLEDDYGYLRISHFSETTPRDLRRAVRDLRRQSSAGTLRGLLLDLRNNPGGVLEAGVEVADAFLDHGVIVSASGRTRDANFRHVAREGDVIDGARMVVLVNAGSASAAEIVAGALRDNHRAVIAGNTTFGKGSVQTVMPLSDGRAIKLTTSRYFTPLGDSIHGEGITPDITLADSALEDLTAQTREHNSPATALIRGDGQLRQALDLLRDQRILHSRLD